MTSHFILLVNIYYLHYNPSSKKYTNKILLVFSESYSMAKRQETNVR